MDVTRNRAKMSAAGSHSVFWVPKFKVNKISLGLCKSKEKRVVTEF